MLSMKDDFSFNVHLVQLVQNYPMLYDVNCEDYINKQAVEGAWNEIAETLEESVEDIRKRWKNIRASMTRHLKQYSPTGSGRGTRVKAYYLAKYLDYLIPFTKSRPQCGRKFTPVATNNEWKVVKEVVVQEGEILDDVLRNADSDCDEPTTKSGTVCVYLNSSGKNEDSSKVTPPLAREVRQPIKRSYFEANKLGTLSNVAVKSRKSNEEEDPTGFLTFVRGILPEVNKLKSAQILKLKMKLLQTVNEISEEQSNITKSTSST